MSRPAFLDNPHGLNVRSSSADPVRYAAAIERAGRNPWPLSDLALAAIAVLVLALLAAGSI